MSVKGTWQKYSYATRLEKKLAEIDEDGAAWILI